MVQSKRTAIILAAIVAVFVGYLLAGAQQPPPPRSGQPGRDPMMERQINDMFREMDVNHSGKISQKTWMDHWTAYYQDLFKRIDKNNRGYITKDDMRADMQDAMRSAQQEKMRNRGAPQ
jgi:hypothetical protein